MTPFSLGILSAIFSALSWGGADYAGGVATKRCSPFQVLAIAASVSMVVFLALALTFDEKIPSIQAIAWSILAGVAGVLALSALYTGIARGSAAIVSPGAAVIGAALPVLLGIVLEGIPKLQQLAGICIGVIGIWFISRPTQSNASEHRRDLMLALLSGIGVAFFYSALGQVPAGYLFFPLALAKVSSIIIAIIILIIVGKPSLPGFSAAILITGILEVGGNFGYLLARQLTRIDVAVVLSSMYPLGTIALAKFFQHQTISSAQWIGVFLCIASVILIAV